jgi:hypothetical protein
VTSTRKRERKYHMGRVPIDQEEAKWQCETCPAVTENPESRWCLSCRMYWEDCRNGIYADDSDFADLADLLEVEEGFDAGDWDNSPDPDPSSQGATANTSHSDTGETT